MAERSLTLREEVEAVIKRSRQSLEALRQSPGASAGTFIPEMDLMLLVAAAQTALEQMRP